MPSRECRGAWVAALLACADPPPVSPPSERIEALVDLRSEPPGARVTLDGEELGRTPIQRTARVPEDVTRLQFELPGHAPRVIVAPVVAARVQVHAQFSPAPGASESSPADGRLLRQSVEAGAPIRDGVATTARLRVRESCEVTSLAVALEGQHTAWSDLEVSLQAPSAERFVLQSHASRNPFRRYEVRRAQGRPARGEWVLLIADERPADEGRLERYSLELRCN
jgi:Proprotein convertase P-domain/PEGA domain